MFSAGTYFLASPEFIFWKEDMRSSSLVAVVVVFLAISQAGCSPSTPTLTDSNHDNASLPVISGSGLEAYVGQNEKPVLVEFGVDFNCPRCQQVKSDIVKLGERLAGRVDVVRVDFNANAAVVSRLGGTICPTYVLFQDGNPVLTRSFPVSADLLEGEVTRIVGREF